MKTVRAAALGFAAVAFAWAVALVTMGGVNGRILGVAVRTHDPMRPLYAAFAGLLLFVLAGGRVRVPAAVRAVLSFIHRHDTAAVSMLAAAVLAAGLAFGTMVAGGSDSYGYVSESDLWLSGRLRVSQPWAAQAPWPDAAWTFSPLGYRPAGGAGETDLVPTYSAGLPLLMAAAKIIGGSRAIFAVVPLAGALLVVATFGIGRRIGSPEIGLIAATFVAASPICLYMAMVPMSDLVASALWAAALYGVIGTRTRAVVLAGVSVSAAILVRPNLFPLAGVMGLWLLVRAWRADAQQRGRAIVHVAVFAACSLPGIIGTAAINQWVYGSPATSGYGRFSDWFAWANILPNVVTYSRWFVDSQSPIALAGLAALVAPLPFFWPAVRDRWVLVLFSAFTLVTLAEYLAYVQLDTWWTLRLLLPCWPLIMIALASLLVAAKRSARPVVALSGAGLVVLLCIRGLVFSLDHGVFAIWKDDRRFPAAAALTAARTGPNSIIFSLMHSGSVRYYAGRMTVRFDLLDPAWLDRSIAWFSAHDVHPYALLEEWELKEMTRRFAGQTSLAAFDAPPVFIYSQPGKIYLFDLLRPASFAGPAETIVETFAGSRFAAPAPPPAFVFKE